MFIFRPREARDLLIKQSLILVRVPAKNETLASKLSNLSESIKPSKMDLNTIKTTEHNIKHHL